MMGEIMGWYFIQVVIRLYLTKKEVWWDQKDEKNGINITETKKYLSFKCMIRSNATMPL